MAEPAEVRGALFQAIDQGLAVPGEIVRAAIYERVEKSYQLKREDIPEKLESFHLALQDLLGAGAKVIEKLIAKSLYRRLGLNFTEHANWSIVDYVNHARGEKRDA